VSVGPFAQRHDIPSPASGDSGNAALFVSEASFHYGAKTALENVSFGVQAGEIAMLLGPNGAGKTTLFSLICGLFTTDKGRILIQGRSVTQSAEALAPLGIVFQSQTLDLDLSIEQNLLYFCALHGIKRSIAKERIVIALKRMDLHTRLDQKVRSLNGGHRQRVEIVRATLHEPSILLLDEPTVGLDVTTRMELIRHLHDLPREKGFAVLWATHLLDEIRPNDRVLLLNQGKLMLDGQADSLLEDSGAQDLASLMQQVMNK
jgi:ABC-2 type transport system ATP-binding protein